MTTEASLQHFGTYFGNVVLRNFSARQAVDGATLLFSCELELKATQEQIVINDVVGSALVKGLGDLGPCWLLNSVTGRTSAQPEKTWFTVAVGANDGCLRALDGHRARQQVETLSLELWLRLQGSSPRGLVDAQAILKPDISTSEWFAALAAAQYEARHIIDVPISGGRVSQALGVAAEHYRRALEQWKKVSYPQVFTECRKVLEATRDVLKLHPKNIAEIDARQKNAWSNREAIEYARAAVHQIVNHSAHPGVHDDPGPIEAELLLGLTGALLRFYADVRS